MVTGWVLSKYCRLSRGCDHLLDSVYCREMCRAPDKFTCLLGEAPEASCYGGQIRNERLKNWTIPRNVCKLARLVEGSMDSLDSIFGGSGCRPSAPITWPMNGIRAHLNLSRLKQRPVSRACCKTARRFLPWSRSSYPYTTMLSAILVTLGKSPKVSSAFLNLENVLSTD